MPMTGQETLPPALPRRWPEISSAMHVPWRTAEIIGISDGQMRRWRERYEEVVLPGSSLDGGASRAKQFRGRGSSDWGLGRIGG
jgi:hypothetical protein